MLNAADLDRTFPRYRGFDPLVPVWDLTPEMPGCFHRFFDTSPLSPSGRFLGVTRYEVEGRLPEPGEPADVMLVDMETGSHTLVAESRGWDTQLGAQVQWGADDTQLFFNDMDTDAWRPFGVRFNPLTRERRELDGTVYMVSFDGTRAISPCLLRTGLTQAGYGVLAPEEHVPLNHGAAADDGVYVTDTQTGECRMLVSYADIAEAVLDQARFRDGDLLVLRWKPRQDGRMLVNLITMRPDGRQIAVAIPDTEWSAKGGHHPNWHPDGEHVTMNLKLDGQTMRLVQAHADGRDLRTMDDDIVGSGHPAVHPDGRHVITDSYPHEPLAFGDGTTPIRWLDLEDGTATNLVRIQTVPNYSGPKKERRVDPHPAWDRSWRWVVFNGCPDGRRSVFLADMSAWLA
jgi:hypothetical protein